MNVLILDPYPKRSHRIAKDTQGGYGTANDYGDGLVASLLKFGVARTLDWPPMHAMYAAAVLRQQGHAVRYARTVTGNDFDLCIVVSSIVCHETEVKAVRELVAGGTPVLVIGSFASTVPEPYLQAGASVIAGEPEMYLAAHGLKDAMSGGQVLRAGAAVSMDALPYPAWDLLGDRARPRFALLDSSRMAVPIVATRGCPYSCAHYCTYPLQQGRKHRWRDPAAIVAEMIHWQDTLGADLFIFRDPVFSIRRQHTLALCDAIEASGRSMSFLIETHLKNIDEELAHRLARAGLKMVQVGIESVRPDVLDAVHRFHIHASQEKERLRLLESVGVEATCFFMVGLPSDTYESCMATVEYACDLNPLYAQFSVFTPYPGTPVFEDYKDRLLSARMEDFTQWNLVFEHAHLTPADIRTILSTAYHRYYTRPRWIGKAASYFARARWSKTRAARMWSPAPA